MKKLGEFVGIEIWIDPKLRPDQARLVSLTFDPISQRMIARDNVPIANLGSGTDREN